MKSYALAMAEAQDIAQGRPLRQPIEGREPRDAREERPSRFSKAAKWTALIVGAAGVAAAIAYFRKKGVKAKPGGGDKVLYDANDPRAGYHAKQYMNVSDYPFVKQVLYPKTKGKRDPGGTERDRDAMGRLIPKHKDEYTPHKKALRPHEIPTDEDFSFEGIDFDIAFGYAARQQMLANRLYARRTGVSPITGTPLVPKGKIKRGDFRTKPKVQGPPLPPTPRNGAPRQHFAGPGNFGEGMSPRASAAAGRVLANQRLPAGTPVVRPRAPLSPSPGKGYAEGGSERANAIARKLIARRKPVSEEGLSFDLMPLGIALGNKSKGWRGGGGLMKQIGGDVATGLGIEFIHFAFRFATEQIGKAFYDELRAKGIKSSAAWNGIQKVMSVIVNKAAMPATLRIASHLNGKVLVQEEVDENGEKPKKKGRGKKKGEIVSTASFGNSEQIERILDKMNRATNRYHRSRRIAKERRKIKVNDSIARLNLDRVSSKWNPSGPSGAYKGFSLAHSVVKAYSAASFADDQNLATAVNSLNKLGIPIVRDGSEVIAQLKTFKSIVQWNKIVRKAQGKVTGHQTAFLAHDKEVGYEFMAVNPAVRKDDKRLKGNRFIPGKKTEYAETGPNATDDARRMGPHMPIGRPRTTPVIEKVVAAAAETASTPSQTKRRRGGSQMKANLFLFGAPFIIMGGAYAVAEAMAYLRKRRQLRAIQEAEEKYGVTIRRGPGRPPGPPKPVVEKRPVGRPKKIRVGGSGEEVTEESLGFALTLAEGIKAALKDLGYTDKMIGNLAPEQANTIITEKWNPDDAKAHWSTPAPKKKATGMGSIKQNSALNEAYRKRMKSYERKPIIERKHAQRAGVPVPLVKPTPNRKWLGGGLGPRGIMDPEADAKIKEMLKSHEKRQVIARKTTPLLEQQADAEYRGAEVMKKAVEEAKAARQAVTSEPAPAKAKPMVRGNTPDKYWNMPQGKGGFKTVLVIGGVTLLIAGTVAAVVQARKWLERRRINKQNIAEAQAHFHVKITPQSQNVAMGAGGALAKLAGRGVMYGIKEGIPAFTKIAGVVFAEWFVMRCLNALVAEKTAEDLISHGIPAKVKGNQVITKPKSMEEAQQVKKIARAHNTTAEKVDHAPVGLAVDDPEFVQYPRTAERSDITPLQIWRMHDPTNKVRKIRNKLKTGQIKGDANRRFAKTEADRLEQQAWNQDRRSGGTTRGGQAEDARKQQLDYLNRPLPGSGNAKSDKAAQRKQIKSYANMTGQTASILVMLGVPLIIAGTTIAVAKARFWLQQRQERGAQRKLLDEAEQKFGVQIMEKGK